MKKLLYTLLAVLLIFSTCKKEDEASSSSGNNNTALAIGDTHQGGIIFYLDGNGGGLIAAPSEQGQVEWGCEGTEISGADGTAIGTGAQNTIDILNGCTTPNTAADICANLTLGGYNDWFLPSKDELNQWILFYVDDDWKYSGNVSEQADGHWSSTENGSGSAWMQDYLYFQQYDDENKSFIYYVRAIRAF